MWERCKAELQEVLRRLSDAQIALVELMNEYGTTYISEWDDGAPLKVDLENLHDDIIKLQIGIETEIKLDDEWYNSQF